MRATQQIWQLSSAKDNIRISMIPLRANDLKQLLEQMSQIINLELYWIVPAHKSLQSLENVIVDISGV